MSGKVTAEEVAKHNSADDCWILVNGVVYDLTEFAEEHPGGAEMIHQWAGRDGTKEYNTYHSKELIEKTLPDSKKKGPFDEASVTQEWLNAQKVDNARTSSAEDGEKPPLMTLINLNDFEEAFAKYGDAKSNAYVSSASNDLITLGANKSYWHKLWFRPRVMRNVSTVNTNTQMVGCNVKQPVWICPMGIAKTAGPQGEWALGAGAAASGIVHCMASTASMSIEDILASVPPTYPYFFQLYVDRQRHKSEEVLKRIEGYKNIKAIFVTADLAVVSKREADERMRTQQVASMNGGAKNVIDKKGGGLARTTGSFIDSALSWHDLAWIRKFSTKKIFVKGIQSAADAKAALDHGCDGIIVSNHGGRALDNAPATVLVLLEIKRDCPEVFEKMEVHVDGGIRRGSDVLKAVLLGVRGVGIGRPFQCAVMYDKEGVETAAEILQDELETAMRLCGITDLDAVRGDMSYLNTSELQQYLPPPPQSGSWFQGLRSKL